MSSSKSRSRSQFTTNSSEQSQSGFTLLELLIAMSIIAIVTATVISQVGGRDSNNELKLAARSLVNQIRLAQDESILQGRELGLRVREHGYIFQKYNTDEQRWEDIEGDKLISGATFDDEIGVELEVDRQLVVLDDQLEKQLRADEKAKNPEPQIWLLPDGGIEPEFSLRLHRDPREPAFEIKLTRLGDIEQRSMETLF